MSTARTRGDIIAVVDDDRDILDALIDLLTSAGYYPLCFRNAESLLDGVNVEDIACVITDFELPDMSGLELRERLAALRPDLPVIILSGSSDIHRLLSGTHHFFCKPFDADALLEAVAEALGHQG